MRFRPLKACQVFQCEWISECELETGRGERYGAPSCFFFTTHTRRGRRFRIPDSGSETP